MSDDQDDDEIGKPVKQLEAADPLNRILGGYQIALVEISEYLTEFFQALIRRAAARSFVGVLDFKLMVVGDKLLLRRALRTRAEKAPTGKWWHLPINPEIAAELVERLKPGPPEEPKRDLEIDASAAPEAESEEAQEPRSVRLLKQRARECEALIQNMKRTADELRQSDPELWLHFRDFIGELVAVQEGVASMAAAPVLQ